MKITIAPTQAGLVHGQHAASIERPEDDLPPTDVVEMFGTALMAYGCDEESICEAFEHYVARRLTLSDDETAHC